MSGLVKADLDGWCQKRGSPAAGATVRHGGRRREGTPARTRDGAAWSENTQARAKAVVLACLNYGLSDLGMPRHPLAHVRPGPVDRRERTLTAEGRV